MCKLGMGLLDFNPPILIRMSCRICYLGRCRTCRSLQQGIQGAHLGGQLVEHVRVEPVHLVAHSLLRQFVLGRDGSM